jgi:hypothetical protein
LKNQGRNKDEADAPSAPSAVDAPATPLSIATVAHNAQHAPGQTEVHDEQVIEVSTLPTWFRDPVD